MFKHVLGYPSPEEERRIVAEHGGRAAASRPESAGVSPVASGDALARAVAAVGQVRLSDEVADYVVALIRATRETASLSVGASPRAGAMLARAARARAALDGRDYTVPDDVKALALPALRHRVVLSPSAEIEGMPADQAVASILEQAKPPR
nr:MoxR family ATPase [Parvularcula dongshanensis]